MIVFFCISGIGSQDQLYDVSVVLNEKGRQIELNCIYLISLLVQKQCNNSNDVLKTGLYGNLSENSIF